jgi:uncharacterized damage-inducible protein DinB
MINLGHYLIWAHDRYRKAIAELTTEEFNRIDKVDRSVKELLVHMISMTESCYAEDQIPVYIKANEDLSKMNQDEILEFWKKSDDDFAKAVEENAIKEFGIMPVGPDDSVKVTALQKLIVYVDHGSFHRGQLLSALKQLGKEGVSSDYFYYLCEKNNKKFELYANFHHQYR